MAAKNPNMLRRAASAAAVALRAFALGGAGGPASTSSDRPPVGRSASPAMQPAVDPSATWTVDEVRSALLAHERGDFSRTALLAEAMGRDDRIGSCVNTRVHALIGTNGCDFDIEPPDCTGDEALAELVEGWWGAAMPDATLRQLHQDVIYLGVAIARVHWRLDGKAWSVDRVERWHPANYSWDASLRCWVVRTATGLLYLAPDDPNWLIFAPGGEQSWMCGAVRALGVAFVMRGWNWRDWARFNERHGLPIVTISEPPGADPLEKAAFYAGVRRMGSTGVVRLPKTLDGENGYELDLVEAKDSAHASFQAFRSDLDVSIAVCLLGQNLTTEVQGGSLAASNVHDRVRDDYLAADAEALSAPLRNQLVTPWCRFNVQGFQDDQAPWPTWHTASPDDLSAKATTLKTLGEGITALRNSGLPLDVLKVAEEFNVPVIEGAPVADVVRPPAPGQGGAQEPGSAPDKGSAAPKPAKGAKALATASGVQALATSGFVEGQTYVDDLVDDYRAAAGKALQGTLLAELLAAIDGAESYEEIRAAVLKAYEGAAQPDVVRDLVQKALVLADLAGAAAVRQDA